MQREGRQHWWVMVYLMLLLLGSTSCSTIYSSVVLFQHRPAEVLRARLLTAEGPAIEVEWRARYGERVGEVQLFGLFEDYNESQASGILRVAPPPTRACPSYRSYLASPPPAREGETTSYPSHLASSPPARASTSRENSALNPLWDGRGTPKERRWEGIQGDLGPETCVVVIILEDESPEKGSRNLVLRAYSRERELLAEMPVPRETTITNGKKWWDLVRSPLVSVVSVPWMIVWGIALARAPI